ncbi:MAG: oxdC [Rubritepida sp.]|nr:oxdC [Rubritepida sp.]
MSQAEEFHNIHDETQGLARELAPGVTTRIFPGEQAMLSVVTIAPGAAGTMHSHPEEQWGMLLEGTAVRIQGGEEIAVVKGDFWRTPGGIEHTMRAGPEGCKVLDVFAPPREAYRKAGQGFASA